MLRVTSCSHRPVMLNLCGLTNRIFHTSLLHKKEFVSKNRGRGGMISFDALSGTRDFLPLQMRVRNWLFSKMHETAKRFGFQEYDTPILESDELYKRKGGEEIAQQMYCFQDRSGQNVALRPEMTPSLARLILGQGASILLPIKWYSIPQCWRFETTTKGRKREHYQLNMDIWGSKSITAEAELLASVCHFFVSLGLKSDDVCIKVSSRKVLQTVMNDVGITEEQFAPACVIIDKLDKIGSAEVINMLNDLGVSNEAAQTVIDVTSIKNVEQLATKLGENNEVITELRTLFELAEGYGITDFLQFDASVVRGLTYYTGIVFEAFTKNGELPRAICGGGRYDRILATYGAPNDIPACGFGLGDVVIMEILQDKNLIPENVLSEPVVRDIVIPHNQDMRVMAVKIVTMLREKYNADIYVGPSTKLKHALSYADRVGAERVIMVMPDEWQKGSVIVKYLRKNTQYTVAIDQLLSFIPP